MNNDFEVKHQSKVSTIFLVFQIVLILLFGYGLSTGVPGAPFAPDGEIALILRILALFSFPVIGITGLILGIRSLVQRNYSLIVVPLLVVSLMFTLIAPISSITNEIAGFLNQNWRN